ncbi:MAG: ABC transporter permease [bacterium]|nr:ABC transporter permease [bacterium]
MRLFDIIRTAQGNLLRSKLRTFLTIVAVFIGTLTLSLTNGVGNGVKSYIDSQLGNVGAKDVLVVQAKQVNQNPVSTDVVKYDPDRETGTFNITLLTKEDISKIKGVNGILEVTPAYFFQLEYISAGGEKYNVTANQYVEGLNIEMAAGRTVGIDSTDEITIPARYVKPLGFSSNGNALDKEVSLSFKNALGFLTETKVRVVGIQENSLLGNLDSSIGAPLAKKIVEEQTAGITQLENKFQAVFARFDLSLSKESLGALKKDLDGLGYSAVSIEDQIGVVNQVIDAILMGLNILGGIALLAASFGIVNTLLMAVNERTREIGLMKALGAHRRHIFAIFAFEAISIGFWGGLLGILVSIGIGTVANNIASNSFLKDFVGFDLLKFPPLPSLVILLGIMLLAFISGALPSIKASRLNPIEALRYE